jgi:hypothetical protein
MDARHDIGGLRDFREQYRHLHVPRGYRGGRHLFFTFGLGSAALVACVLQLDFALTYGRQRRFRQSPSTA